MKTQFQWQAGSSGTATADKVRLKLLVLGLFFILIVSCAFAQDSSRCALKVTVTDKKNKEAIPFASVVVYDKEVQLAGGTTDFDGNAIFRSLKPSAYIVKVVYAGYQSKVISNVKLLANKTIYLSVALENAGLSLDEVTVTDYKVPLIDPDTKSGATMTRSDFSYMADKKLTAVTTTAGVYSTDEGASITVRGGRSDASTVMVDGERLAITGSLPASFGDVEGKKESEKDQAAFKAGTLTAGEVNDFKKWDLWKELSKEGMKEFVKVWGVEPSERYSVFVSDQEKKPVMNAAVTLYSTKGKAMWHARTDNEGRAELWAGMLEKEESPDLIEVQYAGQVFKKDRIRKFTHGLNTFELPLIAVVPNMIDIAFVVDATGSMGDEINYLKAELTNIIETAKRQLPCYTINLGSVFYRDEGDAYVTKTSPMATDVGATINFIKEQEAGGGGDYPEAVDKALKTATEEIRWSEQAAARILFLILDAPPHQEDQVKQEVKDQIEKAAKMGIHIIPVAASGTDKSTEYLLRCMALATNGTYVFLTDHSGVGGTHLKPSTDAYDVEPLNQLLVRLIREYSRSNSCDPGNSQTPEDTTRVIIAHETLDQTKTFSATSNLDSLDQKDSLVSSKAKIKVEKERTFMFFPNPSAGRITIRASEGIKEVFLSDLHGKLIDRYTLEREANEIDLGFLPDGAYLIQYIDEGNWFAGKVILAR